MTFLDNAHLLRIIDKIVSRVGRRIDESSPMVDARLPDGSRINAIIPPSAIDGPLLSIRRFSVNPLQIKDLIGLSTLTDEMAQLLDAMVRAKLNILISGGTGSGKTTLLNILSGFIPADERVVTIEDAAELQLHQPHVLRLETRPANIEGRGEITQRALVKNALRMRPDRIILGEVRGAEALDMLQAMNTGHEGSLATIHANTPRDALTRLENMIGMAGLALPHAHHAPADHLGAVGGGAGLAPHRRAPQARQRAGDHRHGGRGRQHAGDLHLPADQGVERRRPHAAGTSAPRACGRSSASGSRPSASICRKRCSTPPCSTKSRSAP